MNSSIHVEPHDHEVVKAYDGGYFCQICGEPAAPVCDFCGAPMRPGDRVDECSHPEGKGGAAASEATS